MHYFFGFLHTGGNEHPAVGVWLYLLPRELSDGLNMAEKIMKQLADAGYDYAVAIATQAEIDAGAACGQLSLIVES